MKSGSSRRRDTQKIGRYRTMKTLGHGGMGIVFEAHDPELRRDIAVKLLRAEQVGDDARRRMVREAQAMAQVQHPNVISVYDVGTWNGEVFIAMELASGGTLREWCKHVRTPSEIVAAFSSAGRGLAAAHAAGLVHRDFKPDNVLVAADGRMLVTDFGLARTHDMPLELPTPQPRRELGTLTATGTIMGTPGYMAPEQYDGSPASARSDQFAFCVALWEALYEQRPFAGHDESTLAASAFAGDIVEPDAAAAVPANVSLALRRGLSSDPDLRFASMAELLDAIAIIPAEHRGRGLVMIAAATIVAVSIGAYVAWPSASPVTAVQAPPDALDAAAMMRSVKARGQEMTAQLAAMTGDYETARREAKQRVDEARWSGPSKELVGALITQAKVAGLMHDYTAGETSVFEAMTVAERIRDDAGKLEATSLYAHLLTLDSKPDEAKRWQSLASAASSQPAVAPGDRATSLEAEASSQPDLAAATKLLDEALALRPLTKADLSGRVTNRMRLATKLFQSDHRHAAIELVHAQIAELHTANTPDTPAEVRLPLHVAEAIARSRVAQMEHVAGDAASALRDAKLAIELGGTVFGRTSPQVSTSYHTLAVSEIELGRIAQGEADLQRALDIAGSDVVRAGYRVAAGVAYGQIHRTHEAVLHVHAGVALAETSLGRSHPTTLGYRYYESAALSQDGKRDDALQRAEHLLPELEASHADPVVVASCQALLARMLPRSRRTHALELANAARPILAAQPGTVPSRDALEAWFAAL